MNRAPHIVCIAFANKLVWYIVGSRLHTHIAHRTSLSHHRQHCLLFDLLLTNWKLESQILIWIYLTLSDSLDFYYSSCQRRFAARCSRLGLERKSLKYCSSQTNSNCFHKINRTWRNRQSIRLSTRKLNHVIYDSILTRVRISRRLKIGWSVNPVRPHACVYCIRNKFVLLQAIQLYNVHTIRNVEWRAARLAVKQSNVWLRRTCYRLTSRNTTSKSFIHLAYLVSTSLQI